MAAACWFDFLVNVSGDFPQKMEQKLNMFMTTDVQFFWWANGTERGISIFVLTQKFCGLVDKLVQMEIMFAYVLCVLCMRGAREIQFLDSVNKIVAM